MVLSIDKELPILIIGAGLGGLALAQALRKRRVPFKIFERDESPNNRSQGYGLALHWIIESLLAEMPDDLSPFEAVSHLHGTGLECGGALYDGVSGEEKTHFADFIRADRQKLRDWLSTNLHIEWNKKFERYEENGSEVTAYFTDGTAVSGSLLVGADGGHSRVRSQLVGAERGRCELIPVDMFVGHAELQKKEYEQQLALGRSLWIAEAPAGYIFVGLHHIAENKESAKYYWMVFRRNESLTGADHPCLSWSKEQLYYAAIETIMRVNPKFASVILNSKPQDMVQPPYVLEDWIPPAEGFSSARVTLLGDSAHKMSPFGGEGGNHAMQDAVDFVHVLDEFKGSDTTNLLREFEKITIARATGAILKSRAKTTDWENETSIPTWSKESADKLGRKQGL